MVNNNVHLNNGFHPNLWLSRQRSYKKKGCSYHTDRGCSIKFYNSPECLAYICPDYRRYLEKKYKIRYHNGKMKRKLQEIVLGEAKKKEVETVIMMLSTAMIRISQHEEGNRYEPLKIIPYY